MAQNYSNLLSPNQTVPGLLKSMTPRPKGSVSVGAVGTKGGYDTVPGVTPKPSVPELGKASTPVKKVVNADGSSVEYHAPPKQSTTAAKVDNSAGTANPNANYFGEYNQTPQNSSKVPVKSTTSPLLSGAGTPRYPTYGALVGSLASAATDTSAVDKANQDLLNLRQGFNTAVGNIESQPIPLEFQQGRAQILGRQFASQESAAQQALSNALTAKGQAISGLGSAAGFAAPRTADVYVDPFTGQSIGNPNNIQSDLAKWASIRAGANTAGQFTGDYQTGLATLRAADAIGDQIISTLQANPTLNTQPLSAITNIKAFLAGQASDPAQQLLSQQVANYIKTLGIDPNTINLAGQEQSTLGQLLDSLRQTAGAQIEAKNPQNIIGAGQQPQGQSSGGLFDW